MRISDWSSDVCSSDLIAVGMATDVPPHNLRELVAACLHLLKHPNAHIEKLCEFVPAPDYPTGCEIVSEPHDLLKIYQTGYGQVRARARWERDEGGHQLGRAAGRERVGEDG